MSEREYAHTKVTDVGFFFFFFFSHLRLLHAPGSWVAWRTHEMRN